VSTLLEQLATKPPEQRLAFLTACSDDAILAAWYDWRGTWARGNQTAPPGEWRVWILLAGRGFGKTRSGAEWVREEVEKGARHIALVSDTAADTRDVMIEGQDGIIAVCPPWDRPLYEATKRRLTWKNGATATAYAAEAPELLRGPQHDRAWCDELAKWKNLRKRDDQGGTAWDNLMFGLRQGAAQCVVTTTPRPIRLIRDLLARATTVVTRGSSYENRANLSAIYFSEVIKPYEGTRLGRQEINAELLEDIQGALWLRAWFEREGFRVFERPTCERIVVAVDPPASSHEGSDEAGIVVAGRRDERGYVLADRSIPKASPDQWARRAIAAYHEYEADLIVAEVNNGGEMVAHTIHTIDAGIPVKSVHASRGKRTRAEPISAMYEQGRISHCGVFDAMEAQQAQWVPDSGDDSPDRLDACVWALTELMLGGGALETWTAGDSVKPAAVATDEPVPADVATYAEDGRLARREIAAPALALVGGVWMPGS
jgi:phage terminase large subunit-like protein